MITKEKLGDTYRVILKENYNRLLSIEVALDISNPPDDIKIAFTKVLNYLKNEQEKSK